MTKYVVTTLGVVWSTIWFGVAMAFLIFTRDSTILDARFAALIYFVIAVFPTTLIFSNRFATKLRLHKEVQS